MTLSITPSNRGLIKKLHYRPRIRALCFFEIVKRLRSSQKRILLKEVPILRQNQGCWKMIFDYDGRNPMIIWSLGLRILPSFPDFEWLRTGDFVTIRPVENKPKRRKKGVNITRNLVHDGPITANEA
jgi:hypothetical protein